MKGVKTMKRSNLLYGIVYFLFGIICLYVFLTTDTRLDSLLCGIAGAGICSGAVLIGKYIYWTRPKNIEKYEEMIEDEKISLGDERKEFLRNKSGRLAYIAGLAVTAVAIVVFSVLGMLGIIGSYVFIVVYLFCFLAFEYIIGIVIFKKLSDKY